MWLQCRRYQNRIRLDERTMSIASRSRPIEGQACPGVHLTELGKEKRDGGAHRVRVERDDCSGRFAMRPSDLRQDVTSAFRIPSCGSR